VDTDAFAGIAVGSSRYSKFVSASIIGALPGSRFLRRIIDEMIFLLCDPIGGALSPSNDLPEFVGSDLLTRLADSSTEITVFPRHIFNPAPAELSFAFSAPPSSSAVPNQNPRGA
jgi:hypothetical protein